MKYNKHIVVDVETDGAIIGRHSMISFGMVILEDGFKRTFLGELKPISDEWVPEALAVSGHSREKTLQFDDPSIVMQRAAKWISDNVNGKPIFWSDNNGYDASWINYYFLVYNEGFNPFGYSSRRISDWICSAENDLHFNWKRMRRTKHDHNPVNDAKGNAEVLLDYFKRDKTKF